MFKNKKMNFKLISILTLLLFATLACKSKDKLMSYEEVQENPYLNEMKEKGLVQELKIVENANFVERDTLFTIKEVRHMGHALLVEISYGGGCVEPHVFELITDGTMDKSGAVYFWLLHKTHDDECKKLIHKQLTFDISPLETLKLRKVKSIKVNQVNSKVHSD